MRVRLVVALVVMAPIQVVGLSRAVSGRIAQGPASELARVKAAPAQPVANLLPTSLPDGFSAAGPVQRLTVRDITANTADPKAASDELARLGFRAASAATWLDKDAHQFVIVGVTEFKTPAGAAAHKSAVARSWTQEKRVRVPVGGVTGAVAAEYHPAQLPGKYPQAGYSVEFRIERWEFNLIVGTNVGAAGAVATTPEFVQDIVTREVAALRPRLGRYFPAPVTASGLVLHDRVCACGFTAPATFEPLALDKNLAASVVDDRGTDPKLGLIFSVADTATDGTTIFSLFRTPRTASAHASVMQVATRAGAPASAVHTVRLPVGTAYQVAHRPYTAGLGKNAVETFTAFDRSGWTYFAVALSLQPAADQATLDAILRSVHLS
ncbi:MAG TPA: hypothetical protein VHD87_05245 [Acidimicrobiales bacterium]|nr:hypothetical protein [Acidimicrobiales bacterium]